MVSLGFWCIEPASPRTRGWTSKIEARACGCAGFPAHAGMDPMG